MKKPKIIVVLGQTATRKSTVAVKIAKKFNGEVISADSRQVYKYLNIGTHKTTKKEMAGVPHHLISVADPRRAFSVAQFKKLAEKKIKDILKRDKIPIIAGGTGLYIQAVVDNVTFPKLKANITLRKKLASKSTKELFIRLKKLDPGRAKTIDPKNPRRLIRAIEIAEEFGKVPKHSVFGRPDWQIFQVGLALHPEVLKAKIQYRFLKGLKQGMIAEVKKLRKMGVSWKRLQELGLYYSNIALYLQKKIDKHEMIKRVSSDLWHYAKRQKTWFQRDSRIKWFDPTKKSDLNKIEAGVKEFLK